MKKSYEAVVEGYKERELNDYLLGLYGSEEYFSDEELEKLEAWVEPCNEDI